MSERDNTKTVRPADEVPKGPRLCEAAVQELVDLVLDSGGLTDQEALLLLAILARLERMQSLEGPRAAADAAREIREIWLAGDEPPPLLN